jgi:hypothetical protein
VSFIFRTIFWLTLAIVVLPPQQRLGGQETADFEKVDLELELHNAAYTAWSLASNALNACDSNPQLCSSTAELWQTAWTTVARIAMTRQELEDTTEIAEIKPDQEAADPNSQ